MIIFVLIYKHVVIQFVIIFVLSNKYVVIQHFVLWSLFSIILN